MHNLQGDKSSDEEDLALGNVPDDDEYDTEDSFIDDSELVCTTLSSSFVVRNCSLLIILCLINHGSIIAELYFCAG